MVLHDKTQRPLLLTSHTNIYATLNPMLSLPMNVLLSPKKEKKNYRDLQLIVILAIFGQRVFELPYDVVTIFLWALLCNGILLGL